MCKKARENKFKVGGTETPHAMEWGVSQPTKRWIEQAFLTSRSGGSLAYVDRSA